jgi:hypothetical protein
LDLPAAVGGSAAAGGALNEVYHASRPQFIREALSFLESVFKARGAFELNVMVHTVLNNCRCIFVEPEIGRRFELSFRLLFLFSR